jgi:bZIP transcription factor
VTVEERKQRNRRAQAAFRERRTVHTRQLESDKIRLDEEVRVLSDERQKLDEECAQLFYRRKVNCTAVLRRDRLSFKHCLANFWG